MPSTTKYSASSVDPERVVAALKSLEGRWKLVILSRLLGPTSQRFSDLDRSIPGISQKVLIQQLRQLEADGIVRRVVHDDIPGRVEYCLSERGAALAPALDALLIWARSVVSTGSRSWGRPKGGRG
jgi:DNA-binding HxlR family transcriptional regulator